MGFFTDLKEDLSELMPDEPDEAEDQIDSEVRDDGEPTQQQLANLEEMLQNIDELRITEDEEEGEAESESAIGITVEEPDQEEEFENRQGGWKAEEFQESVDPIWDKLDGIEDPEEDPEPSNEGDLEQELRTAFGVSGKEETMEEYLYQQTVSAEAEVIDKSWMLDLKDMETTDENAVITAGMRVKGDILSNGNLDVTGEVIGNIQISGKLNVTGRISGNSKAEEIYADAARITGDLIGDGTVKIGAESVVKGNIEATSAVIAGAVKGIIDVKGPVILDATAVVYGNIRAKSIQINNGARIDGMCLLCYAEQSASKFFEDQENI